MANYLEKQLADLQISIAEGQRPIKKPGHGPAVPPKNKKAQPQVPRSCQLNGPSEPSYTSPLLSNSDKRNEHVPLYSNINPVLSAINSEIRERHGLREQERENPYVNVGSYAKSMSYQKAEPQAPLYTNISQLSYTAQPSYANLDDLGDDDFPPPPPDLPPPPSPVSSSYSELRRATQNNIPEFATYTPPSQSSSTYDSLYEPITPRPPSGMSSNYSTLYYGKTPSSNRSEAEVDALTNLLVQSMDSPNTDPEFFGNCCKCLERVVGEDSGCTAMDQVYHILCFTCAHCDTQLQGKPFYILDGSPYCEQGYLLTLEKCSVCVKPILDRILRATGRPYHPQCFTCVVCGKSLDGIPFTVDATNQIHCIDDFHKKFAPRCCVCFEPIMPEPGQEETVRVVALDRSFHIKCYKCEDCGLVLSSEAEGRGCYPLDDHVLCKSCNAKRVRELTSCMTTDL